MHNRLQNWRPSQEEVQEGHSNAGPEHELRRKLHTISPTATRF